MKSLLLPTALLLLLLCFSDNIYSARSFAVVGGTSRRLLAAKKFLLVGSTKLESLRLPIQLCMSTTTTAAATMRGGKICLDNPLLQSWASQPLRVPPFQEIETHHFQPALEEGMRLELEDLQAIVDNPDEPTFDNVLAAYDRSGRVLEKVASVYSNMCSSLCTEDLQEVQTTMSPILSRHSSKCMTLPGLFEKVDAVHQKRHSLGLNSEQLRLAERVHLDFTRAGATLSEEDKKEFADLKAELASLTTQFQQNVMKDEETYEMVLKNEDLKGCPDGLVQAARQAAVERKKADDEYVITLGRSLVEPFLTYSSRRDLRKQAFEAWTQRGELSKDRDNLQVATKILRLRKRMAELHDFPSFAHYQCVDSMAKTPDAVMKLLTNVWDLAKQSAQREREDLEAFVKSSGEALEGGIQPWDWRYYAEKVRIKKYNFDESLLKPYLSLEKVTEALFAVSKNLYGLKYIERPDIQSYHPDVKTYEVREELEDGTDKLVAIFIHDNFARKYKNSGDWMSEYRTQTKNLHPTADGDDDAYLGCLLGRYSDHFQQQ